MQQASQSNDDPGDVDAWMVRRNAQLALRAGADTVARDLWNQATIRGTDVFAGNPSDLTAIGLAALSGPGSYLSTAANNDDQALGGGSSFPRRVRGPKDQEPAPTSFATGGASAPSVSEVVVVGRRRTPPPGPSFLDRLNHDPVVRSAAGMAGYAVGLPAGVLRGGLHALEGVGHGLNFVGGLIVSPQERSAAWNDAQAKAHSALQYGRSVMADPSRLASDALAGAKAANRSLNPLGTTIPDTASGAFDHELGIGANGGETLANIAGFFAAPEFVGGVNAAHGFAATREVNVAKMVGQGLNEPTARYLSKRYEGRGDHALIPKAQDFIMGVEAPAWFKKVQIPEWIMDSPLNVSKPRGLSQGDFYDYHYQVDPRYYGSKLPKRLNGGKGWSGERQGVERYSGAQRLWARTPTVWKDAATGISAGEALGLAPWDNQETPR